MMMMMMMIVIIIYLLYVFLLSLLLLLSLYHSSLSVLLFHNYTKGERGVRGLEFIVGKNIYINV